MEYATALLLAESAFENYSSLSPDFPKQVDAMLARLDAARAAACRRRGGGAPMLDEMSKRAQERVLLAQVGREIQANLRHMEQVLDAFFRDNSKRAELAALAKDSAQIRGALRILGLDDADRLLGLCQEQIETYADPGGRGQQRRPRAARRIAVGPRLLHRGGRAAASRPRPADRAADREAPGRGAGARGARAAIRSRRRSPSCAPRCRSSSTRCTGAERRRGARQPEAEAREPARRCGADRRRRARRAGGGGAGRTRGGRRRAPRGRRRTRSRTRRRRRRQSPRRRSGCSRPTRAISTASSSRSTCTEAAEVLDGVAQQPSRPGATTPATARRCAPCAAASTR